MDQMLADSAERLFSHLSTPAAVMDIERGADAAPLWQQIDAAGFVDALTPEAAGGAGMTLHQAWPLLSAAGRHALPLPLAATCWARALLAAQSLAVPTGPITIAAQTRTAADGAVVALAVPFGRTADSVILNRDDAAWLLPVDAGARRSTGTHGSLQAHLHWAEWPAAATRIGPVQPCNEVGALLSAGMLAGAMRRTLELTVAYANERVQFGRSIGKFQAVQQQLAEMAELVHASALAAEMGARAGIPEHAGPVEHGSLHAALAKARTSAAVGRVAAIAHAVHGAIGVTAEYSLQLWTRRLHEWRLDFGSESWWHQQVGNALLASGSERSLEFLLQTFEPAAVAPAH